MRYGDALIYDGEKQMDLGVLIPAPPSLDSYKCWSRSVLAVSYSYLQSLS